RRRCKVAAGDVVVGAGELVVGAGDCARLAGPCEGVGLGGLGRRFVVLRRDRPTAQSVSCDAGETMVVLPAGIRMCSDMIIAACRIGVLADEPLADARLVTCVGVGMGIGGVWFGVPRFGRGSPPRLLSPLLPPLL